MPSPPCLPRYSSGRSRYAADELQPPRCQTSISTDHVSIVWSIGSDLLADSSSTAIAAAWRHVLFTHRRHADCHFPAKGPVNPATYIKRTCAALFGLIDLVSRDWKWPTDTWWKVYSILHGSETQQCHCHRTAVFFCKKSLYRPNWS